VDIAAFRLRIDFVVIVVVVVLVMMPCNVTVGSWKRQ